jgi:hypothetical protein
MNAANRMYPLVENGGVTSNGNAVVSNNEPSGDTLPETVSDTALVTVGNQNNTVFWLLVAAVVAWIIWGNK